MRLRSSTRTTRRTESTPPGRVIASATITLGLIIGFVALAVTAQKGVPGRSYSTLYVSVPETGSLRGHDKVAIGGVRVGQVKRITTAGDRARVALRLDGDVKLPSDTTVRLRANGLLGARYVQLIPGRSRRVLGDGATIRGGRDALTATVPDALDVFNADTRGALGTAVTGLGRGLVGNGEPLNEGIRVSSDATAPFSRIMDSIMARPGAAARLLPALDSAVAAVWQSRVELRRMFDPAARALRPFGDRREQLRATLDEAPPALAAANAGLGEGTRLLTATRSLATAAQHTLPAAPAGLRATAALLRLAHDERDGATPLQRATRLLTAAEPAVPAALNVTNALRPVLPRLNGALASLVPIVNQVAPYGCGLINTGATLRSMTGFVGTGTGPNGPSSQFRLQVVLGAQALGASEVTPTRDAYHHPCKYPAGHYDVTPLTGIGGPRR